ncbi:MULTISPECIES: RNA 2'-phosphotransferase [Sorangium]|uniref:RNA 2'-phosphotransferase n=1 Tax=Sorangium TaxID=39643 RepID=UPI003D9C05E0
MCRARASIWILMRARSKRVQPSYLAGSQKSIACSRAASSVKNNTKNRLEIRGDRMRASQGHSREGMPVTLAGLEASWEEVHGDAPIWHGTSVDAVRGIAREGIRPAARTHVHCTDALDSAVGKRAKVDVMLEISPARLRAQGIGVFRSQNGVILVREVPVGCIVGLVPFVARAKGEAEALRALLLGAQLDDLAAAGLR